ncbi:AraC family transcriptional regulator [uncultured Modestobacter sp.]|uniref:helix-turn-helix domain-containing protein n=1 Tax=uncultured Modestobacter sp. TaxID=380048 RepID=UPI002601F357|nr:AraC family transcriptional regulator [uncultured Modestobacter sp.]
MDPLPQQVAAAARIRLPVYDADAIEVPFVALGWSETIGADTWWDEHAHPTHELLWNQRGASSATAGARHWTLTPAQGLWVPAGVRHSGWAPAGTQQRAVHFSVRRARPLAAGPVAVQVTPLLRLLLDRLEEDDLAEVSRATTEAMVLDVLCPAPRELCLPLPGSALLAPVVAALRADPADPRTLAEWATQLQVSARTVTRAFQAETGLGFGRWVAAARVQHAIALLAQGEGIEEIAGRTGFGSVSAFGAAFRRVTGTSPGRFRAQ